MKKAKEQARQAKKVKAKTAFLGFNIILLGFTSLLTDISSEMILPLLPLFIVSVGGSGIAIGLIGGLGDSIANLLKIFSGYASDRVRKRKPFVFAGYLFSGVSKLFYAFSTVWPYILILRSIERIGKGLRSAPRDALIAQASGETVRGKAFGIHRAMDTGGAILGSIMALLLFLYFGLNFFVIFITAALIAFSALIPLKFVKESRPKKIDGIKISFKGLPASFYKFLLVTVVFALANFTYMFFILKAQRGLQLTELNATAAIAFVLMLYIWFNIVYTIFSIPAGVLADKIGKKKVLVGGYLLFALTCLGFAFLNDLFSFIFLFALYGVFYALVEGNQRAFASAFVPKELEGTAMGTFHTFIGLAAVPAGLAAGFLWQINPQLTFFYGAAVALLSALVFALTRINHQAEKAKPAQ